MFLKQRPLPEKIIHMPGLSYIYSNKPLRSERITYKQLLFLSMENDNWD